ncbi:MAG: aminoglycoside phosphotransferase family protein [Pseudomonadota bacterium]
MTGTGQAAGDAVGDFLAAAGWGAATRRPLAGDASSRRYERLSGPAGTAILMDAGPAGAAQTRQFARLADWLRGQGYSAPAILARHEDRGLLLVEDLGDDLLARLMAAEPERSEELCALAVDVLADLGRRRDPPEVPVLDAAALGELADLASTVYAPAAGGCTDPELAREVTRLCRPLDAAPRVLSLRDFHVENLLWLPDRAGLARLGLLDFQDAVLAPPAYDLASLTRDARRDVDPALARALERRFAVASGRDPDAITAECALLGAQRSLRILGVFARLGLRDGKPGYLAHLPRVWSYLMADLQSPGLSDLRARVLSSLPEPTPDVIARIRRQCPTARPL